MKTCPECGIALKDEYQFCPEDGASLAESVGPVQVETAASAKPQAATAVVLYCPACAAEYPLTFSECPVHHTTLTTHGIPSMGEAARAQDKTETPTAVDTHSGRLLHFVSGATPPRRSGIEEYEQALENLAQPAVAVDADDPDADDHDELPPPAPVPQDEGRRYRVAAIVISVALVALALIGIYAVISNASRKPAQPSSKKASAKNNSVQPLITVPTPQAAVDYQDQATASAAQTVDVDAANAPRSEVASEAQTRARRNVGLAEAQPQKVVGSRTPPVAREPMAAPSPRPAQPAAAAPAVTRQPAATELVLPRGTFGLVDARLTGVRASRTAGGYRYDLTFHMADQAGHATQWERLAIVTRAASGASRQQQIPFYHRLGADGTLRFTVSVEMPGRAPADWQGRIICTSIGSDASGKTYRASFGANVSPN
jgi:hypothetical protein